MLPLLAACTITAERPADDEPADSAIDTADTDTDSGDTASDCADPVDWYGDADQDGYGTPLYTSSACEQPTGYVANDDDCDDTDDTIAPGAEETCDDVDQDCDGTVDEDATDAPAWNADLDADGYGDPANTTAACDVPAGYTADAADCDDAAFGVNPSADETCDGEDDDCDGEIDEDDATDALTWYADTDGDGYGDPDATAPGCEPPEGYLADDNDCDDARADANPLADEVCNGEDDDCDTLADDNPTDPATWYFDADGDGYGRATSTVTACDQPPSYVATGDDCNDVDDTIHPDAADACDTTDSDCDGEVAEDDSTDTLTWYADTDGDGFGDAAAPTTSCELPTGYVADATDCNDTDDDVSPDDLEYCGGADENCDGATDESTAADVDPYYADLDLDTYGDPDDVVTSCTVVPDRVTNDDDCDDTTEETSPDDTDTCNDGIDQDCDGVTDGGCWTTGTRDITDADVLLYGRGAGAGGRVGGAPTGGMDLTGDAVPDLVISTYESTPYRGYFVVDGTTRGSVTLDTTTAAYTGPATQEAFQHCTADIDGDGIGDVFGVASDYSWLNLGPFSGTAATGARAWYYSASGASGAYSHSCAMGDVDGDGLGEVIVGVPYDGVSYGAWGRVDLIEDPVGYLYFSDMDTQWTSTSAAPELGDAVAGGEDVDGDGLDDLVMTSTGYQAFVVLGPATSGGAVGSAAAMLLALTGGSTTSAVMLPDADGDGLADVLVGSSVRFTAGAAEVFTGLAPSASLFYADAKITGEDYLASLGEHVAGADIDGDGLTDILAAGYLRSPRQFFSPLSGTYAATDSDTAWTMTTYNIANVANAGDVDGLGFDSVMISSPYDATVETSAGLVGLFLGAGD